MSGKHKGKPLYIQGPNDSPEFVSHVLTTLRERSGPVGEKFNFTALAEDVVLELADVTLCPYRSTDGG